MFKYVQRSAVFLGVASVTSFIADYLYPERAPDFFTVGFNTLKKSLDYLVHVNGIDSADYFCFLILARRLEIYLLEVGKTDQEMKDVAESFWGVLNWLKNAKEDIFQADPESRCSKKDYLLSDFLNGLKSKKSDNSSGLSLDNKPIADEEYSEFLEVCKGFLEACESPKQIDFNDDHHTKHRYFTNIAHVTLFLSFFILVFLWRSDKKMLTTKLFLTILCCLLVSAAVIMSNRWSCSHKVNKFAEELMLAVIDKCKPMQKHASWHAFAFNVGLVPANMHELAAKLFVPITCDLALCESILKEYLQDKSYRNNFKAETFIKALGKCKLYFNSEEKGSEFRSLYSDDINDETLRDSFSKVQNEIKNPPSLISSYQKRVMNFFGSLNDAAREVATTRRFSFK